MKTGIKIALSITLLSSLSFAGEQFAMSDSDRAMYTDMLENNPADLMISNGEELLEEYCGGDAGVAAFFNISEDDLPAYIAGFPRYLKEFKQVVTVSQALQGLMSKNTHKPFKLKSSDMFDMSAYVKTLANGEKSNIDVNADKYIKEAFVLGEKTYMTARGGRGLSCNSCHSADIVGAVLRTQPLPDLTSKGVAVAATWPAYRMTKSSLRTLPRRFQGCMKNALLKVIPLGSPEMVALEVYLTHEAKGTEVAIPGLKR
ncbi:sulfur oxidation c-type cytochrome SoxA [Sulfurimonas sp.]|jgi:L-cysteine S-thiosulfotransferase|uniref:sulfur oxidation c-type cytochrome SoxA n=1 Tax=Sulfurimonas sp. TaxID=2022749 RepID=UPI0025DD7619|nr:sulfur oxidation c-type cytochrome SoxA [Sulfurimonas sp.]MBT5935792.1 sulfur oxidation c-type cytochrome SoxA [Sulfurimonas sp.]